jgi:quercetin dioxygenase-like cupin family protein
MNDVSLPETLNISSLEDFENLIRQLPTPDAPITEYFSEGVYARELFIPKGAVLTGKIHKFTNLNIMISGEISVSTEDGMQRIKAPFVIVSPPGTKRVAYAHEDTRWITVHGTSETDVSKIEQHFVADTAAQYITFFESQKLLKEN